MEHLHSRLYADCFSSSCLLGSNHHCCLLRQIIRIKPITPNLNPRHSALQNRSKYYAHSSPTLLHRRPQLGENLPTCTLVQGFPTSPWTLSAELLPGKSPCSRPDFRACPWSSHDLLLCLLQHPVFPPINTEEVQDAVEPRNSVHWECAKCSAMIPANGRILWHLEPFLGEFFKINAHAAVQRLPFAGVNVALGNSKGQWLSGHRFRQSINSFHQCDQVFLGWHSHKKILLVVDHLCEDYFPVDPKEWTKPGTRVLWYGSVLFESSQIVSPCSHSPVAASPQRLQKSDGNIIRSITLHEGARLRSKIGQI